MKTSYLVMTMVSVVALGADFAQAESITNLGDLTGGVVSSYAYGISADGQVIIGNSASGSGSEAFRWTQAGGMVGLGDLPGSLYVSSALTVSADGSVVGGVSFSTNGLEAFRWTQAGGMVGLGDLPGGSFSSAVTGMNADGSVIVGAGIGASGTEAFRWTQVGGMVGLGDLAGGTFNSSARGISADGSIIVGYGTSAAGQEAFRWTQVGGMVGLGDLAGGTFDSFASAISADGTTIVGYGNSASGREAFRWTQVGGMVGLGDLAGGTFNSNVEAVNADGSVLVGIGNTASGQTAFRWTQANGMQDLNLVLSAAGVDMTGWLLRTANGVDATGNLVVGEGTFGGNNFGYLANLETMAVTTPVDMVDGLVSALVPVEQSRAAMTTGINQSLFAATHSLSAFRPALDISNPAAIAPAAGGVDRVWSGYVVGSFGAGQDNDFDNNAVNGTMGVLVELDKNLVVGAGIIGSHGRADRRYSGDSFLDSKGGSVIAAYAADNGLRLYGTAFVADLQIDSKRGYLNGAGLDASYADIDGIGFGAALRGGYEFAVSHKTNLMPYVEIQASRTKLDGYTETGGGFPATFGDTTSDLVTSYIGTEISYELTSSVTIGGRAAWAHRLKEDDDGLTASVTGFTGTLSTEEGDQNWGEGAVTASWQITEDTRLGTELSGRSGKTQDPAVALTLGLQHRF